MSNYKNNQTEAPMSNDKLAVVNVNGTSLESYQSRDEVRELTDRLLSLHPAAGEVGKAGMIAVAQLALLVGASPLPGTNEIHVWKSGNKIQFQLGINFYRRKRDEQGGILWSVQPRQMREDEREENGVAQGILAAICKGVKASDMKEYHAMGFSANQIFEMKGATGIGTASTSEGKAGRTAVWTAFKRCEVDLYRALFPTMMAEIENAKEEKITISGPEWKEFTGEEVDEMFSYGDVPERVEVVDFDTGEIEEAVYEEVTAEIDETNEEPEPAPKHEEIIERLRAAVHPNKSAVASDKQLKFVHAGMSKVVDVSNSETDKKTILAAIFPDLLEDGEISTRRMTIGQASVLIDWLGARPPGYEVQPETINEARVILAAVLAGEGQMPLFGDNETGDTGAYAE